VQSCIAVIVTIKRKYLWRDRIIPSRWPLTTSFMKIKSLSTTLACALIFAFFAAAVAETEPKYPVWPAQVHFTLIYYSIISL
jgi:hypothetical protein